MKKICSICKKFLSIELYHRQPNRKDGRDGRCSSCMSSLKSTNYKIDKYAKQAVELHEELLVDEDILDEGIAIKLLNYLEKYE